jgi:uncharacterized membrane protein
MNWLAQIFSHVCGQVHCWAPGGVAMPVCERCLGLYLGALWSLGLIVTLRAAPSRALVWLHGMAMLAMLPFGYHLVPHGPTVRTVTGFLFGVGMVYYLVLIPADVLQLERVAKTRAVISYAVAALMPLPWILLAANYGSRLAGWFLALLAFAGLALTTFLVVVNAAAITFSLIVRQEKAAA